MRADAKNLQAITRAVNDHNLRCGFPATAIAMSPFERSRLGWDEIMGLPIVEDGSLGTGVFRVLCDRDSVPESEAVETRGRELAVA